jgi:hypothetical protein
MDRSVAVCLLGFLAAGPALPQRPSDFDTPRPLKPGEMLVVGFLGGWERWNDPRRGVRRTVLSLRGIPGIRAESVENHKRHRALRLIVDAFDRDRNGRLDPPERRSASVILFGQSLGGAAVVRTARELDRMGIRVLLTIQVDSVGPAGSVIPPNVAEAVNFFQRESWPLVGEKAIRAADPARTSILGNFEYSYKNAKVYFPTEPWRVLGGSHAKMEQDPELWLSVQRLISEAHSRDSVTLAGR